MNLKSCTISVCLVLVLFCLASADATIIVNSTIIDTGVNDEYAGSFYLDNSDVLYMDSGIVHGDVTCYGNSTATFDGGTVVGLDVSIIAREFSSVYIYGGNFKTGIGVEDNSHIYIYGGEFGEYHSGLDAYSSSVIIDIFGYDFSYENIGGQSYLNGKWEDSTPFSIKIDNWFQPFSTADYINLHIVPEPCSLILLGLGGLILRKRS